MRIQTSQNLFQSRLKKNVVNIPALVTSTGVIIYVNKISGNYWMYTLIDSVRGPSRSDVTHRHGIKEASANLDLVSIQHVREQFAC
jgi:hypothetical protein